MKWEPYELKELFINNGWTWLTAVNNDVFTYALALLNHFINNKKRNTKPKMDFVSFIVPITGILACFTLTAFVRLLGWYKYVKMKLEKLHTKRDNSQFKHFCI